MDQQDPQECKEVPAFLLPKHSVFVSITDAVIVNNSVNSSHSSGGGLFLGPGGALTLQDVVCADNIASQFGGGVALGTGLLAQGSCAISGTNVSLLRNAAQRGGSQLYMACSSDVELSGTDLQLTDGSQVRGFPGSGGMLCT
jgi:hypothetical protein